MDTMSAAIAPLKQSGQLNAVLSLTRDTSTFGFVVGVLVSLTITAIFQSSGATIGVLFALCQAGVFGELREVFPLIIGTHVGTCSATLLGAVGTNIEARRSAYSHVCFNLVGTVLASLMLPFYLWIVPLTSHDLTRQIANSHTLVQLINSIIFLPFAGPFAKLVTLLSPSKEAPQERSHLNDPDLDTPELAIANAMREARRMAAVTRLMLVQAVGGLLRITSKPFGTVVKNEAVVDMMKDSINDYLAQIAARKLSTRQAILLQHLMVTVADLERVGDHIESITELTQQKVANHVWFDQESMSLLVEQYQRVDRLLRLTILSLDPELRAFKQISDKMLELRREFIVANRELRSRYRQLIIEHHETSLNGLYYDQFLRCFERIVRHTKSIARLEQTSFFTVKPHKFMRKTERASTPVVEASNPLQFEESILREDLHYEDLGIDLNMAVEPDEITKA
jgi:phosphate:Na+ symporter